MYHKNQVSLRLLITKYGVLFPSIACWPCPTWRETKVKCKCVITSHQAFPLQRIYYQLLTESIKHYNTCLRNSWIYISCHCYGQLLTWGFFSYHPRMLSIGYMIMPINRNFSGSEVYPRRRYTSKPRFHKHLCKKTQHRRVISGLIFNSAVEILHTLSFLWVVPTSLQYG